ncbi:MAG: spore protease YyaC [Firmicutes bacterium]|nr:spore protease YyaC [Bacillota bacterium]
MLLETDVVGRTHWNDPLSSAQLAVALASLPLENNIDIVCVGTDRSTGDSLGPFIGSALQARLKAGLLPQQVTVYGTIHEPVHALNLKETAEKIGSKGGKSSVIAIDACLGRVKNIGYISVKRGPLQPGTGVNKQLPSIGDYHIIGVVNVAGFMEHVVLQNTRLSLVIQMADVITEGITLCLGSHSTKVEVALGASQLF